MSKVRHVYMVLSPRALGYAQDALDSLFANAAEPMHLRLITDSEADKAQLNEAVAQTATHGHEVSVYFEDELADREAQLFAGHENLRSFRKGHPCWRKITDPLLLSEPGEELVLLDPDLYFPNRFTFEPTLAEGLLLMWQQPNCLFPPEVVRVALDAGIRLANHVDIGVAHWRADADFDWLDWLIGRLGGTTLPRLMHIEAIVWSALAMRVGGGHLDPDYWKCWRRTIAGRLRVRLGTPGVDLLKSEAWNRYKCFHAGGEAKWWLHAACEQQMLVAGGDLQGKGRVIPYVELTSADFARERALKDALKAVGFYRLFRTA